MSKELFFQMREGEMQLPQYAQDVSKKEIIKTASVIVQKIKDEGNINVYEFNANLQRYKVFFDELDKSIREILPKEKVSSFGLEYTPVNGGETLNYSEDPIYCELKQYLENRVNLLKLAQKQFTLDPSGNEVPKVSTTPRKSSITIKF
jgi:hypothetical protein